MKTPDGHDAGPSPLAPAAFYILFALAEGEKHGYAIMQETVKLSDGKFRMGPATLYTNVQRLVDEGLIKEVAANSSEDRDPRRRYYRLGRHGKIALEAELERMRGLLYRARKLSLALKPLNP